MTHWRKLIPSDYLGSWDFDKGEVKTLTIKSVRAEKVEQIQGQPKKFIIEFTDGKPMIANVTNMKTIGKVLGTDDIEKWAGNQVMLGVEKVQAFKEVTDAIRVVKKQVARPKKPIKPEDWGKAIDAVKAGAITAKELLDTRELTAEQVKELKAIK